MVLGQDASFTVDSFEKRYNADLANDFGNLVNRIFILISKNFDDKIPCKDTYDKLDNNFISDVEKLRDKANENYTNLKIHDGIESSISIIRLINKFLEDKAPWKTIKENKNQAGTTIYLSAEALRIGSILLYPIIPEKTNLILKSIKSSPSDNINFGQLKEKQTISIIKNIFPRIQD
tara:strand:- start:1048 stop:1578 length:531 start_codon:yes stop_codon:yes gene_type:complete